MNFSQKTAMMLVDIPSEEKLFPFNYKKLILNCNSLLLSRNMTFYLINTEQMHGKIRHIHVCLSAINHQIFMDVIICLHESMKDGLQENKLSACREGQLHKQLCLRICGSGGEEGRRKKNEAQGVIKKNKRL